MRLARFGEAGAERPCVVLDGGRRKDATALLPPGADIDGRFLGSGGPARLRQQPASAIEALPEVPASARWGSCVARPGKLVCIGLNYADHAAESGMPVPSEPVVFLKATNTVVGPYDRVLIPRGSVKTDWEVELGVVIGSTARYCAGATEAAACIAGYCVSNDVSERAFQLERGGQWTKGKSCDTFNPLGPWLLAADRVADPQALAMRLDVNGERQQTGSTRTMVFGVVEIVRYLSQFMTLEPGDVITTGTPPGVGLGKKPPRFLRAGDVMELEIDGLGMQRQTCEDA